MEIADASQVKAYVEREKTRFEHQWEITRSMVLNCITLWNTVYLDTAIKHLRATGYPVLDADAARLSPYVRKHINVHGHYSFQLPEFGGDRRALRDPTSPTRNNRRSRSPFASTLMLGRS